MSKCVCGKELGLGDKVMIRCKDCEQQISDLEAKLKALQNGIIDDETLNMLVKEHKLYKDLEAKLAESEKQIKDAREAGNVAVDSWCKNRRKYEAQIAEMQNKSFILYSMLYETLEKQGCNNVASQIDQMTGWTYDKETDWLKGNRNYDQLKQQLSDYKDICHKHHIDCPANLDRVLLGMEEENKQLKQQLAESETQLKEEIEEKNGVRRALTACNRQNDEFADMIKKLVNENEELKSQIHSQPKEIVDKIKDLAGDYFYENYDDVLLTGKGFTEIIEEILKEYGGKYE